MLLIKNIVSFVKNKTFSFFAFFIALIITFLNFLVISNYTYNLFKDYSKYEEAERSYVFSPDCENIVLQTEKLITDYSADLQHVYAVIENDDSEYVIADIFGETATEIKVQFGRYFSKEDIVNGNKVVLMANDMYLYDENTPLEEIRKYTIGDSYSVNGEVYQIIGISSEEYYQIPYLSVKDTKQISNIVIVTQNYLSKSEQNELCLAISKCFEVDEIRLPAKGKAFLDSRYFEDLLIIFVILLVGVASYVFLFNYIFDERKKEMNIFRICGCGDLRIVLYYFAEIIIYITVAFVISLLFVKCVLNKVSYMNFLLGDSLSLPVCLLAYIGSGLLLLLTFLPVMLKMLKNKASNYI